ncbi:hypothetical protein [Pseudescherichia sp.]|uniref:hypothetical protein n=1 Tax=Pseudescherichia sp. TaxID=2055881 RepID=UPI0028AF45E9|nr:hypothetical protein [Pseudescherichia sp.]
MAKYEVIRPWFGVVVGDIVEFESLNPAFKSNVRLMCGEAGGTLNPATPVAISNPGDRKGVIAKRLKDLGIEFDGRKGADELASLLPDGELEKLFPAE